MTIQDWIGERDQDVVFEGDAVREFAAVLESIPWWPPEPDLARLREARRVVGMPGPIHVPFQFRSGSSLSLGYVAGRTWFVEW